MTTTCYLATAQTLKPKRLAERLGFMGFIIGFIIVFIGFVALIMGFFRIIMGF